MARTNNITNFLTDVATAIRTKGNTSSQIPASEFDTAIANLPGADIDWTAIGYSGTPSIVTDGYAYAQQIYDNWNPSTTDISGKYRDNRYVVFFPLVDTSNVTTLSSTFFGSYNLIYVPPLNLGKVTNMNRAFAYDSALAEIPDLNISSCTTLMYTFQNCYSLKKIGQLQTGNVTDFYYTFQSCNALTDFPVLDMHSATSVDGMLYDCTNLTDESLDNVLQSLASATSYTGTKTLSVICLWGYNDARIQACPHYQDFVNAGWSIR